MQPCFSRENTGALKGIALILMFFHHFFTFPSWYGGRDPFPVLFRAAPYLSEPAKICVAVFAFLTGYFYAFGGDKGFRYTVRKLTDFLPAYWVVFALLLLLAKGMHRAVLDPVSIGYELFALERPVMSFCWYVHFYCISIILLPGLSRLMDRGRVPCLFLGIFLPIVVFTGLSRGLSALPMTRMGHCWIEVFGSMAEWFPVLASGYYCGRYGVFEAVSLPRRKPAQAAVSLLLCAAACAGRYVLPRLTVNAPIPFAPGLYYNLPMDILYAPAFVYGCTSLIRLLQWRPLDRILQIIGKYSMYMWFFHCVFFNVCRDDTQRILLLPRFAPLVLLWGLALCLGASALVDWPVSRVLGWKNKLLSLDGAG